MTAVEEALFNLAMTSLERNPQDWTFSKYEAENTQLRITIWLANRYYATRITGPGVECGAQQCTFSFLQPWRRRIVRAAEKVAIQRLLETAKD